LYFDSHHLENNEAKTIIKNEFKILNHDTVISDSVLENSAFNIQITTAHIPAKQIANTMFEPGIFFIVCFPNKYNTQVINAKGTIVNNALITLKIINESPDKLLSTKSLAKRTKEDAPCSKLIQKNTVKKANITTAIIRSLTTFVYLDVLVITKILFCKETILMLLIHRHIVLLNYQL